MPTIMPRSFTSARSGNARPDFDAVSLTSSYSVNALLKNAHVNQPKNRQTKIRPTPIRRSDDGRSRSACATGQPANRTVTVVPQIAIEANRSTTLMTTIDVRTALPTAIPTPAGPPEAWYP